MIVVMQYQETSTFPWRDIPLGNTSRFMVDIPFFFMGFSGENTSAGKYFK